MISLSHIMKCMAENINKRGEVERLRMHTLDSLTRENKAIRTENYCDHKEREEGRQRPIL